ncbi:hypothetical protein Athai_13580 [Actinocatenispora thailandica]|uniref:Polyketide synthase n=1 Tax=Actinocatenispora thailandica TaxID=227318 RepID=A0A7R7DLG6_9ACTN|nr:type I polyketide synthase [Actinocatenispora thailandica]BCJ33855.1 hypothetical protein Athai_13580 [Actinocatenispora thailandica]
MTSNDIAVIAMAGRFPGARSVAELWRALRDGRELISRFSREELIAAGVPAADVDRPDYVPARGVLPEADLFDAELFGYSPREAELIDPQQRLFLECAWEAAEEAGFVLGEGCGRVGVFAAAPASTYPAARSTEQPLLAQVGNDVDFLASRVSYKLNLSGPSVVISSACSSSLVAVHLAAQSLLTGEVDLALAGGASVRFPQVRGYRWAPGSILSPDGHCRSFGTGAEGTVEANGVAVVLLKRLDRALVDGNPIHAVIKGSAIGNDAADRVGFTAPGLRGQIDVMREALALAGVDPRTVGYVEAHGTATNLGDPIEIRALATVYGLPDRKEPCAIGSLKSNLGHLNHVAGLAGLVKAVLCLKHRHLAASLHAAPVHPDLDLAGGALRIQTEATDWDWPGPRRAAVSSFGMGGTNVHVVLEEPPASATSDPGEPADREAYPLLVSARTGAALAEATARLGEWLRDRPSQPLDAVAWTLQRGRRYFRHRAVVVARDANEAAGALLGERGGAIRAVEQDGVDRPVAFLFPGQGAQYLGMGRHLYRVNEVFREHLDECARLLDGQLDGADLREVIFGEAQPTHDLNETWLTQPALFAVEYSLASSFIHLGIEPSAMLGNSVGGYVAACLCGVFSLPSALDLVAARGRLMQQAPVGAMLAIGAGEDDVTRRLRGYPSLALSAVNAPDQCVVGGDVAAVEALRQELASAAVPVTRLRVNRAFHTPAVQPLLEDFAAALKPIEFALATGPFVSDLTGNWASAEEVASVDYWVRHLCEPTRFGAGIAMLRQDLDPVFLEVGPGRVGVALAAAQGAQDTVWGLVDNAENAVAQTLGNLWLAGVRVDWARGWTRHRPRTVVLPTYPFQRRRHWWATSADGNATAAGRESERGGTDRWFSQAVWREQPRSPVRVERALGDTEPRWVLVGGGADAAEELASVLRAAHREVDRIPADAADPGAYRRLAARIARADVRTRVVRLSDPEPAQPGGGPAAAVAEATAAYGDLALLVRSLAEANAAERIRVSVVTGPVCPVGGDERLAPSSAAVAGVITVVSQEFPGILSDHVEVHGTPASALAHELAGPAGARVALRGHRRFVRSAASLDLAATDLPECRLRHGGLYVVTGGLGRLGLLLARYLGRQYAAKLLLVGRRPAPMRHQWAEIAADPAHPMSTTARRLVDVEAAGAQVLPIAVDVAEPDRLAAALAEASRFFDRPVHGVIHAAAVTETDAFKLLADSGEADAERHLRAKLGGVRALRTALAAHEPDFVLAFSSLATLLGGLGFGSYAAANACLEAEVRLAARSRPGAWSVVNFDGWEDPDEGRGSAYRSAQRDARLIREEDADDVFDRVFRLLDLEQVYVSVTDLADRLERAPHPATDEHAVAQAEASPIVSARHPRPELSTRYRAPSDALEEAMVDIWQDLVGIESIGVDDDFFELGGHSLLAMQLVARLRDGFDLDVPLLTVFEAPTVGRLCSEMESLFRREGASP